MSEIKTCEYYVLATLAAREEELENCHNLIQSMNEELTAKSNVLDRLVDILKRHGEFNGKGTEYWSVRYLWNAWGDEEDYQFMSVLLRDNDDRTEELIEDDTNTETE